MAEGKIKIPVQDAQEQNTDERPEPVQETGQAQAGAQPGAQAQGAGAEVAASGAPQGGDDVEHGDAQKKGKHSKRERKLEEQIEQLNIDVAGAQAETSAYKDKFLRLQAEWENFRKRTASERAEERERATEHVLSDLLPIIDDLERALAHAEGESADGQSLREGLSAIDTKLNQVLSKHGLEEIDPKGQPFDANLHNAVSKVEDSGQAEDTVVEVYQKGYRIGAKVLRPAMVTVAG
jgi:molecular chaperone GrpE